MPRLAAVALLRPATEDAVPRRMRSRTSALLQAKRASGRWSGCSILGHFCLTCGWPQDSRRCPTRGRVQQGGAAPSRSPPRPSSWRSAAWPRARSLGRCRATRGSPRASTGPRPRRPSVWRCVWPHVRAPQYFKATRGSMRASTMPRSLRSIWTWMGRRRFRRWWNPDCSCCAAALGMPGQCSVPSLPTCVRHRINPHRGRAAAGPPSQTSRHLCAEKPSAAFRARCRRAEVLAGRPRGSWSSSSSWGSSARRPKAASHSSSPASHASSRPPRSRGSCSGRLRHRTVAPKPVPHRASLLMRKATRRRTRGRRRRWRRRRRSPWHSTTASPPFASPPRLARRTRRASRPGNHFASRSWAQRCHAKMMIRLIRIRRTSSTALPCASPAPLRGTLELAAAKAPTPTALSPGTPSSPPSETGSSSSTKASSMRGGSRGPVRRWTGLHTPSRAAAAVVVEGRRRCACRRQPRGSSLLASARSPRSICRTRWRSYERPYLSQARHLPC
mmetsp:Transcript_80647/g.261350  ORF Transcript_80647/g.261350 Transcript_80647/m.261350 type:complete len:502 (-) Transcript_80647:1235-2740(-)